MLGSPCSHLNDMTYEVPYECHGNSAVGHRRERQPNDHDDLKFLEVHELGNHADGN